MSSIDLRHVNLDYPLVGMGSRSLKSRLLGTATGGLVSSGDAIPVVKALRDVTFSLSKGDRLGLVGHNGAGKSTLLKVLAGIYQPTGGTITTAGRIVSTLNISLGMEPEATGFENIVIRGLLLGMKRSEINEKIEEIALFTELGDYLNMPVRIYSSGMATRLAFATVTAMDSDILLMDEVIGTGDASFMDKAERRLNEFLNRSKIIVLASHSDHVIKKFCNRAILLEHGQVLHEGTPDAVIEKYHSRAVGRVGA
ncbi:MAG: ABC transporter ATP-binding protein [Burkholderiales bacterium PBB1]|nr:MAG: ABC transporter ATP-binding protein [Burkholderiales bacterium PBB1]